MTSPQDLSSAIDALVRAVYRADEPGAAVIATRAGQTIYRGAAGIANLELGVPLAPEMVFRLASVSKQFTAVATLMLMEQGLLSLGDPITRFLPEYPTHGHTITVEHLLTHTSGIRSYTDMEEWRPVWRKDFTVAELIDFFKKEPMQFAPGARWAYNNSGYHLLGAIIEKVAEMPYAEFLQQRIFGPLGMRHTGYDDTRRIVPGRVAGYAKEGDAYLNADYMSMTQPYAAGGLLSTVDDLALWDASLANATLLKPETLERAWTPFRLTDGSATGYGYGWSVGSWQGRRAIDHSGGIHGFSTHALRMPEEQTFVAVLSNNPGGPDVELLALRIAALVIGAPYEPPAPVPLSDAQLDAFAGVYQLPGDATWTVTREGGRLVGQHSGWPPFTFIPVGEATFIAEITPLYRLVFLLNAAGEPEAVEVHSRRGVDETAARVG